MKRQAPRYPLVRCAEPGHADAPGYAVCSHVIEKGKSASVLHFEPAKPTKLGVITCGCTDEKNLTLVCARCCRSYGWFELRRHFAPSQPVKDHAAGLVKEKKEPNT